MKVVPFRATFFNQLDDIMSRTNTSLVIKGIKSENYSTIEKRIREKIDNCKKKVVKLKCHNYDCNDVYHPKTLHVPSKCYSRICPFCKVARQLRLVKKYSQYINIMVNTRFMTLTLKETCELTKENKHIMDRAFQELFRELRENGYKITRYIKGMELKKTGKYEYRFHYHIIYEGSFIPQKLLSDKWKIHSKGSFIVDIRKVYNKRHALFYISKYISKSVDYDISIVQYAKIRKMRFFNSYGFKGIELDKSRWSSCEYCGARRMYSGEYENPKRLEKCVIM